jgi:hypothetical protein
MDPALSAKIVDFVQSPSDARVDDTDPIYMLGDIPNLGKMQELLQRKVSDWKESYERRNPAQCLLFALAYQKAMDTNNIPFPMRLRTFGEWREFDFYCRQFGCKAMFHWYPDKTCSELILTSGAEASIKRSNDFLYGPVVVWPVDAPQFIMQQEPMHYW